MLGIVAECLLVRCPDWTPERLAGDQGAIVRKIHDVAAGSVDGGSAYEQAVWIALRVVESET